jgi:hypothetical protein
LNVTSQHRPENLDGFALLQNATFISFAWEAAQVRRNEFLLSEGTHLTGFGDLFQVDGNVIKSLHCAIHGRVRQVKDINSVLYFFT